MESCDAHPFTKWFADISIADVPLFGGKTASLGEMVREFNGKGSDGHDITAEAYRHFIPEAQANSAKNRRR